MKRRKRKRDSKAASNAQPVAQPVGEPVVEPVVEVVVEPVGEPVAEPVDELVVEVVVEPAAKPVAEAVAEPVVEPVAQPAEKPSGGSVATAGADRRTHARYEFTAAIEVVAGESGPRMEARVRDLGQQGCYVDTDSPLPLQTVAEVRITKGERSFEARAMVVYCQAGKGMGLFFKDVKPEQREILQTWLADSRETSWLAANRRRSQRVLMKIPVRVSGQTALGLLFEEETHTLAVSAHGALISVSTEVNKGQRFALSNVQTKAALECVVAHISKRHGERLEVGVEFMLPNPIFWHVAFPPKDWTPRHPDAKSHIKASE